MTCAHVLGLIDAGPFADYPATHLEAAWEHARGCGTCGPALRAAVSLTAGLADLPQAEPPAHLATAVMAQIARLDARQTSPAAAPVHQARVPAVSRWHDRAAAFAGVTAGGVVMLTLALAQGLAVDMTSSRLGAVSGLLAGTTTPLLWGTLAASLLLYLIALFVPLRSVDRRTE